MTPAARIQAAIDVLDDWRGGAPVEKALTNWSRGARYAGSKDRAAVRDHVFDVLRCKGNCAALGGGDTGRALMHGLVRLKGLDPEEIFTGAPHAPAPLSAAERSVPLGEATPNRDVPDWLLDALRDRAGGDLPCLLQSFQTRAPLYLRVNRSKADIAQALDSLEKEGIAAERAQAPFALKVTENPRRLRNSAAYLGGLVEPQDLSVQLAMDRVNWPEQGRILDFCAGGGGKTLALAERSDAAIFAHDANPRRMVDLSDRAARAGVRVTQITTDRLGKHAPYDAILCDVPCSGSGTWRRDPEAKWALAPADLEDLCRVQAAILAQAAPLLRAGGLLVYMTCSLLRRENEAQVLAFQDKYPGWSLVAEALDTPLTASDGFFHAVLRKPEKA